MAWTMQSALTYMQPAKRAGKMRDITEGLFWPITNDAHNGMNQSGVNCMQPAKSAGKACASKSQLQWGLPLTGLKRGTRKGKEIRHLFSRALWFQSSPFVPSRYHEFFLAGCNWVRRRWFGSAAHQKDLTKSENRAWKVFDTPLLALRWNNSLIVLFQSRRPVCDQWFRRSFCVHLENSTWNSIR